MRTLPLQYYEQHRLEAFRSLNIAVHMNSTNAFMSSRLVAPCRKIKLGECISSNKLFCLRCQTIIRLLLPRFCFTNDILCCPHEHRWKTTPFSSAAHGKALLKEAVVFPYLSNNIWTAVMNITPYRPSKVRKPLTTVFDMWPQLIIVSWANSFCHSRQNRDSRLRSNWFPSQTLKFGFANNF